MNTDLVTILEGNTFVVSDANGDIEASLTDPTGLFSFDTRFLSRWLLTVNGESLNPLSVDDLQYFETQFFLVPGTGTVYVDAKLSVIRRRAVGDGFHEELTILNHDEQPVDLTVRIEAGSDFADLFEVKDALKKKGRYSTHVEKGRLVLQYERETFTRATAISASAPAQIDEHGWPSPSISSPHGEWTTDLDVVTVRRCARSARPAEVRARRAARPTEHGAQPGGLDRGRAPPGMRPGHAEDDLPPQPRRPRRAALLTARRGRAKRCRPPVCPGS